MTKLKAVQRICQFCGLGAPGALATGTSSNAGMAELYLDEADTEIQSFGWRENTDDMLKITRSGSNTYTTTEYGTDVLFIRTTGPDADIRIREVNDTLEWYDLSQTSDPWTGTFNQDLRFYVIRQITFTQLTETLAAYIAAQATLNFFSQEIYARNEPATGNQWKFEARRRIEQDFLRHKQTAEQADWNQQSESVNLLSTADARMIRGRSRSSAGLLLFGA